MQELAEPEKPDDSDVRADVRPLDATIAAAKAGDAAAREAVLVWLRPKLRRWAEQELAKHQALSLDASSVVQDTLLSVHERLAEFSRATEREFLSWAQVALRNDVVDAVRRATAQKRSLRSTFSLHTTDSTCETAGQEMLGHLDPPSLRARLDERAEALLKAVCELTPEQAQAIRLVHLDGLTVSAAAERMGKSKMALAKLLQRGMAVLRTRLPPPSELD